MTLHIQTSNPDPLFQKKKCPFWALWFEPYLSTSYHGQGKLVPEVKFIKCKLHGSLQALRKELQKEYQTLFIFLLTPFVKTAAWVRKQSVVALETQVIFFLFNDTIYTAQLMGLASVHHHFKRQPLCSSAYI